MSICKLCWTAINRASHQWHPFNIKTRMISISTLNNGPYKKRSVNKTSNSNNIHPGIGQRLKILKEDMPDVESKVVLHEEDFEELEGDVFNAREMQKHISSTAEKLKHRDELKITERKHFKPDVQPNLLTWSEKEQIRLLHSEDPVKWNIDKLSDSFPATPLIIKKVISSSWIPDTSNRVKMHDERVSKNWKELDEGRLHISCPLLKQHLKKFSKRTMLPHNPVTLGHLDKTLPKPRETEFVNIIHSYKPIRKTIDVQGKRFSSEKTSKPETLNNFKKIEPNSEHSSAVVVNYHDPNTGSSAHSKPMFISNKSSYTLDKLRDVMQKKQSKLNIQDINENDREILKGKMSVSETVPTLNAEMNLSLPEDKGDSGSQAGLIHTSTIDNQVQVSKNKYVSAVPQIKTRIHIPKSKVKVGYLYKVEDCFYSHDGYFLYRVPGIISGDN